MDTNTFNLETSRLDMRPFRESDLDEISSILSDPEVARGLLRDISTPERLEGMARSWLTTLEDWQANSYGIWLISDRGDITGLPGRILGLAGTDIPLPLVGQGPECFYLFSRAVWGQGVAREAMESIFEYIFDSIGTPAIEAQIFSETNPGSVALAQKLGMVEVGNVNIIGHHLDHEGALETIDFEIWRVSRSNPDLLLESLDPAAYRIGQFVSEGVSNMGGTAEALVKAAEAADPDGLIDSDQVKAIIASRLQQGMDNPGFTLYRIIRDAWVSHHKIC